MTTSAVDLGAAGRDNDYGYGRVDAAAALAAVLPPTTAPHGRTVLGHADRDRDGQAHHRSGHFRTAHHEADRDAHHQADRHDAHHGAHHQADYGAHPSPP